MNFLYDRAKGNFREADNLYTEGYPQHRISSRKLFSKLYQRLGESGPFVSRETFLFERTVYGFTYIQQDYVIEICSFMSVPDTG